MHKTVLVTGPSVEPVTVAEIQTHTIVTGEDAYLGTLITTARRLVERYLNRALITQQWKVFYDKWVNQLKIPFPPLVSVQTVKYYDGAGALQTLAESTYYWTVNTEDPGSIVRKYDASYPDLQDGRPDSIEIAFTAGYGAAASAVPEEIRHAIKVWVTDLYEHRGTIVIERNQASKIPNYVIDLIHSYKIYEF